MHVPSDVWNQFGGTDLQAPTDTSSPVIGPDRTLYIGTVDGRLVAIDPVSAHSSPAIGPDGTVYVAAGEELFAFAELGTPFREVRDHRRPPNVRDHRDRPQPAG